MIKEYGSAQRAIQQAYPQLRFKEDWVPGKHWTPANHHFRPI